MSYSFFDPTENNLEVMQIKIKNLEELHYIETQKDIDNNPILAQINAELTSLKSDYEDAGGTL